MATADTTRPGIELLSIDAARAEIDSGVELIDVREQSEWDEAHLEAATHVPQGELLERIDGLVGDTSERLLLYCRTDNRSSNSALALRGLGYDNVAVIEGGITAWSDANLPLVEPEGLSREQRMRYSRHTLLPEVGVDGQLKMLNARVLLLGAGGLGAPSALYLAAAGIGTIGIVDDDVVDESNLQRQVIHNTERVGIAKTTSAKLAIEALNPDVEVIEHNLRLDASNILELIEGYDVIVDGADNFPTRYLLNDAAVRLGKPVISASILGLRRPDLDLRAARGAVLSVPLSGPAAARARPELRRQRGARRDGRSDGAAAGQRGDQADRRDRRAADRAPAALRVARDPVHGAEGKTRPGVPDLRRARARDRRRADGQVPRLRAVLRSAGPRADPERRLSGDGHAAR